MADFLNFRQVADSGRLPLSVSVGRRDLPTQPAKVSMRRERVMNRTLSGSTWACFRRSTRPPDDPSADRVEHPRSAQNFYRSRQPLDPRDDVARNRYGSDEHRRQSMTYIEVLPY